MSLRGGKTVGKKQEYDVSSRTNTTRNSAKKKDITLILVNGFHIKGIIKGYDVYSIFIEVEGKQQLVYKHAVSTIRL